MGKTMKKILKYSLFGLGGVIALFLLLAAVIAATFNPNDYKPLIVKMVKEKKITCHMLSGIWVLIVILVVSSY